MKELSIEEKAKVYDALFVKAQRIYNKENDVLILHTIEDLFPELKENEDERIRKKLIEAVKGDMVVGSTKDKQRAIVWLEKQGEQNLNTDFSDLRTWKYIVDAVLTEKEGIGQYLDSPFTEEVAKKLQKRFGNIEQKPAWSEEDDIMVHDIDYALRCQITYSKSRLNSMSSWIYELKDRIQPKQEWSEEDEDYYDAIIAKLEVTQDDALLTDNQIEFLKSLKYRYTWKPSDEQMVALDGICSYIRNKADWEISQDMVSDLYKLSEQLKKLREE